LADVAEERLRREQELYSNMGGLGGYQGVNIPIDINT
jgi:hypothetical protein